MTPLQGVHLKKIRKSRRIGVDYLSDITGIPEVDLKNYERGKVDIPTDHINILKQVLLCSEDYLKG